MHNKKWFNKKSHDSWSVFKVMGELVEGYENFPKLAHVSQFLDQHEQMKMILLQRNYKDI